MAVLLLVPWIAVRTTFDSPPEPVFNLEHTREYRFYVACAAGALAIVTL